jgi:hypothetical protein
MQEILLSLPYFGPISHFMELVKPANIRFENEDNYQKQTYRNRMYIYDANRKLLLNIPIKHLPKCNPKQHQKYKDVKIDPEYKWQKQHWKSLKTAYQTSPFFEFYEDELAPLYQKELKYLMDFNYSCFEVICGCLQLNIDFEKTLEFIPEPENVDDKRELINAKIEIQIPEYNQVFQEKHGFLPNLSMLDLMFNEGPNSLNYLKKVRGKK